MADVQCECGHLRGEHREMLSHHPALANKLWCFSCECQDFKPASARAHRPQEGTDGED